MNRWDKVGVPHKGWECVNVYDLKENDAVAWHSCEMCGQEEIRYVHVMEHPDHPPLEVGCVCAGKMSVGYDARRAEADLKNRQKRRDNFRHGWKIAKTGNYYRKKNGTLIIIGEGRYGGFWVRVDAVLLKTYPKTFPEACDLAFDAIDRATPISAFRG